MPVGLGAAVWPGDEAFRLRWTMEQRAGASVNVAAISSTVHLGTHADAFLHVGGAGEPTSLDAASMPLECYLGRAVVVDVRGPADAGLAGTVRGTEDGLPASLAGGVPAGTRVLLRTRDRGSPWTFEERFRPPSLELVSALANRRCPLLGTDAPSVDAFDSKDLPVHRALAKAGIAILENLALDAVPEGEYELVALPLRLVGCDASPVRAILRTLP